jgi:nucleotide-binding universal stress UspA family protein
MSATPRRILVGFDGSASAERALDQAAGLAGYGSTLTVIRVSPDGSQERDPILDRARERLLRRNVPADYIRRSGEAAAALVEAASELGADLLVVGRRATGERDDFSGSVSAAVLRLAGCDVLVVQ